VSLVFEVSPERQAEVAGELGISAQEIYNASDNTITLRYPDDLIHGDVAARAGGMLVMRKASGTSGRSGHQVEGIAEEWGDAIDLIIDAGPTKYSKPSTMLRV